MAEIVGIGANVCDTLISVPSFPTEDTKIKATSIKRCGGGPCATGLVAASKLGGNCSYIGLGTNDDAGVFLLSDFKKYGVCTKNVTMLDGYLSFSSYVILSENNASRTCVFDRGNIPVWTPTAKQIKEIEAADVLMVDGNEMVAAAEAVKIARNSNTKVLYDAGGLYDGVEDLLKYTDILIPSEEFALGFTKAEDAESAAKILYERFSPEVVVITQGKEGGVLYNGTEIKKYNSFVVDAVDTNGCGDVFHGAFAFAVTKNLDYYDACIFSSAVSALKCKKIGAREAVPKLNEVLEFLKEHGYEFEKNME